MSLQFNPISGQFDIVGLSGSQADATYLRLDTTNNPLTGALTIGLNGSVLSLGDNTNSSVYSNIQGTRSYVGYDANGYAVLQGGASKGLRLNVNNATFGVGTAVEIDTAGQFKMANATASGTGILLGGDANLYRSSANTLTTDDSMQVLGTSLYANGNLSVGPGNTSVGISVRASSFNGFTFDIYSDTGSAYSFFRRTRGSLASPTVVTSGSFLGSISYRGYADAGMPVQDAARISGYATQTFSTTMGAALGFYTAANGTSVGSGATERMTVYHDGNVGIGNTVPTFKLQLAAATTAAGGIGFGTDTVIYRQGADQLATDDRFYGLGGIVSGANDQTSNLWVSSGSAAVITSTASLQAPGSANTMVRASQRGSATTITANAGYASWMIGTNVITEAATGTHPFMGQLVVRSLNPTGAAGATTDAATVYIEGAQSGITPTGKNLSLWVAAGDSEFDGNVIVPTPGSVTGSVVTIDATQTQTNKRITPRIGTVASSATPTPTGDASDQYNVTALATNATFAAPSGTPTDGQKLMIRIKDDGTSRTLGWNAIYASTTNGTLPAATTISKTLYVGFIYDSAAVKWFCVGATEEV